MLKLKLLESRLFMLLIFAVLVLLGLQFVILGTIGTAGPDISKVRNQREELELDNELKTAQIRQEQTNAKVLAPVNNDLQMQPKQISYIYAPQPVDTSKTAQQ